MISPGLAKSIVGMPGKALDAIGEATSFLGNRRSAMAGYAIGGFAAGGVLSNIADARRNYYGEAGYEARYGGSLDFAAKAPPYVGMGLAGAALFRMDPMGIGVRTMNTASKYLMRTSRGPGLGAPAMGAAMTASSGAMAYGIAHGPTEAAMGVGGIAGLGLLGGMVRYGGMGWTAGVVGAAGLGAGSAIASNNYAFPAGEGRITSFRSGPTQVGGRMNFSTAGLVQALHTNRRSM